MHKPSAFNNDQLRKYKTKNDELENEIDYLHIANAELRNAHFKCVEERYKLESINKALESRIEKLESELSLRNNTIATIKHSLVELFNKHLSD